MPKGPSFPISKRWQEDVLARIREMGITQNELARRAKISKASLSEALADGAIQSRVMPAINKALGWPEPPAVISRDALELLSLYTQMSEMDKGAMLERARVTIEQKKRKP